MPSDADDQARPAPLDYRGTAPVSVEELEDRQGLPGIGLDRSPRLQAVARSGWFVLRLTSALIFVAVVSLTGWVLWRVAYDWFQ